jgi:glycyl-tRNA synthetase beta chain
MKNKFLFELGAEEIPAEMISSAEEQLRGQFGTLLSESRLTYESLDVYSTPRRLTVIIQGLPDKQEDRVEVTVGPSTSVAFSAQHEPTPAAVGFARKMNVPVTALEVVDTERGLYVAVRRKVEGGMTPEVLCAGIPGIITALAWPKSMYWRESRFRFVRPIRWLTALWNSTPAHLEFEGVRSGVATRGHRFLGRSEITLRSAGEYRDRLRESFVIADVEERRTKIRREIETQTPAGLRVLADPKLLDMLTHLNEYPSVVCGAFEPRFLELPQEVLVTVMRHHQKYFSLVDEHGAIQPYFLAVLNTNGDPDGVIRQGHEKVLRARLEDGAFFWANDQKTPLRDRAQTLDHVLFQEKLGSYLAKTERVRSLCARLWKSADLDTAAQLCKCDLTADMVREFTELQGVMGGLYARREGYAEAVWRAVYEHYQPVSLEDPSPSSRTGALLSVADKLDTVVGCFGIDIVPTGSSDPFALRRQAQGLVKVLLDHRLDEHSLEQLVAAAQEGFHPQQPAEKVRAAVVDFLAGRVRFILQERGFAYDVINAVLAVGVDTVYQTYLRAEALSGIRSEPDFEAVATAYKRMKNILAKQPIVSPGVAERALEEPAERALYLAYTAAKPRIEEALRQGDYAAALVDMARLRAPVDLFFDRVLVMAEDDRLRDNRLRLLFEMSQMIARAGDISEIVHSNEERFPQRS